MNAIYGVLLMTFAFGCEGRIEQKLKENYEEEPTLDFRVRRDLSERIGSDGLKIVTLVSEPYTMIDEKVDQSSQDRFIGFIPDLIFLLSKRYNFTYTFYLSPDGRFGKPLDKGNKVWNGMVGELVNGSADVAASPMTITRKREEVIDFVNPFSNLGLTVVIKKPNMSEYGKAMSVYNFDIVRPLSAEVWGLVIVTFVVVWLFTWLMNCFNPYEYGERHKRALSDEREATLFNVTGSLWFAFTLFAWQGYDRSPRSLASKTLSCFWMFFVVIFMVTYTGSMVNHLFWASTVHGKDPTKPPVLSLADLVQRHDDYTYGFVSGGSTENYFRNVAKGAEYDKIRSFLQSDTGKASLVNSIEEGFKKAREEKYGFICESMIARYMINQKPCDLTNVDEFAIRSYGLALRRESPHREDFHSGILEMIETGDMEALEKKWFEYRGQCWMNNIVEKVVSKSSQLQLNTPKRVSMASFWSSVVLMVVGLVLSIIVAVAEILYYKYRGRYQASNRQRTQQLTNEDDGHI